MDVSSSRIEHITHSASTYTSKYHNRRYHNLAEPEMTENFGVAYPVESTIERYLHIHMIWSWSTYVTPMPYIIYMMLHLTHLSINLIIFQFEGEA